MSILAHAVQIGFVHVLSIFLSFFAEGYACVLAFCAGEEGAPVPWTGGDVDDYRGISPYFPPPRVYRGVTLSLSGVVSGIDSMRVDNVRRSNRPIYQGATATDCTRTSNSAK